MLEKLTERLTKLEERITDINKWVSEQVSFIDVESQRKATEDKLLYQIDRECSRVRKHLELSIKDLGQSVIDCLKRRDQQLDQRLQAFQPFVSTPIQPMNTSTVHRSPRDQTYSLQSNTQSIMDSSNQYLVLAITRMKILSYSSNDVRSILLFDL